MIDFLLSLPLWALAVCLNVWLIGFALLTQWVLRQWVLPRLRIDTNAALFYGLGIMSSALVLYGLVAALTAVSVWQRYSQVEEIVSSEATAISMRAGDGYSYAQVWVPKGRPFAALEPMTTPTNSLIDGSAPLIDPGGDFRATFALSIGR